MKTVDYFRYLCEQNCSFRLSVKLKYFFTKKTILLAGIFILLFPALLTHLDLVALYDDEAIRALVALEMKINGDFVVPTLFGKAYYNKPTLYNWMLHALFELTGRNDEFMVRLPTIFFLLAFCFTIFKSWQLTIGSRQPDREDVLLPTANYQLLTALAFLTCGRILFWDSMLGLIDLWFSWMMYMLFMVVFSEGEKGRYGRLFFFGYALAAVGFMLKALPAIVFLGTTLLTYFIWRKKWKLLFSWQHVLGSLAFILPVGAYYWAYAERNGLEVILQTIFNESAKRTAAEYGWGQTVAHLFTFPFEVVFHFLPWTILVIYFFRKNAKRLIQESPFISWNLLVYLTTILPYWISVQVYPRYLFMHVPLLFTALFYLHAQNKKEGAKMTQVIEIVFFALCLLATAASLFPLFWDAVSGVPSRMYKVAFLSFSLAGLSLLFWRWKQHRFLVFVLVMLMARMGFNWFILPTRPAVECSTKVRDTTLEAIEKLNGEPVDIYKFSVAEEPLTGYLFAREQRRILRREHENFESGKYYLIRHGVYSFKEFELVHEMYLKQDCGKLLLMKKK